MTSDFANNLTLTEVDYLEIGVHVYQHKFGDIF